MWLVADHNVASLLAFRDHPHCKAESGTHGSGKRRHGRAGADIEVPVPPGTTVHTAAREVLADLRTSGERWLAARGGQGGRGNARFLSNRRRAPSFAEQGEVGEERWLELELKLVADVALVGFPNVGKSTLISRISAARPRIADYPFTTLEPHLGVVRVEEGREMVVADIPGLIEGASEGRGLGHEFLRHIERARVLAVLVDLSPLAPLPPADQERILVAELAAHRPDLVTRPRVVVGSRADLAVDGRAEAWDDARDGPPDEDGVPKHVGREPRRVGRGPGGGPDGRGELTAGDDVPERVGGGSGRTGDAGAGVWTGPGSEPRAGDEGPEGARGGSRLTGNHSGGGSGPASGGPPDRDGMSERVANEPRRAGELGAERWAGPGREPRAGDEVSEGAGGGPHRSGEPAAGDAPGIDVSEPAEGGLRRTGDAGAGVGTGPGGAPLAGDPAQNDVSERVGGGAGRADDPGAGVWGGPEVEPAVGDEGSEGVGGGRHRASDDPGGGAGSTPSAAVLGPGPDEAMPPGGERARLPISAVTGAGVDRLVGALADLVDETRQDEPRTEGFVVYRPAPAGVSVARDDDGSLRVHGRAAERAVALSDLSTPDAQAYVRERFDRLGVTRALVRAGAGRGDVVRIGGFSFDYIPDDEPG